MTFAFFVFLRPNRKNLYPLRLSTNPDEIRQHLTCHGLPCTSFSPLELSIFTNASDLLQTRRFQSFYSRIYHFWFIIKIFYAMTLCYSYAIVCKSTVPVHSNYHPLQKKPWLWNCSRCVKFYNFLSQLSQYFYNNIHLLSTSFFMSTTIYVRCHFSNLIITRRHVLMF